MKYVIINAHLARLLVGMGIGFIWNCIWCFTCGGKNYEHVFSSACTCTLYSCTCTLYLCPVPCTLCPTLYPVPCTCALYPVPCTLCLVSCILCPVPLYLYPVPLYPVSCTLYLCPVPVPCTLYPVPCALCPVSYALYPVPCALYLGKFVVNTPALMITFKREMERMGVITYVARDKKKGRCVCVCVNVGGCDMG